MASDVAAVESRWFYVTLFFIFDPFIWLIFVRRRIPLDVEDQN